MHSGAESRRSSRLMFNLTAGNMLILCALMISCALHFAKGKCPPELNLKPNCWCLELGQGSSVFCQEFGSPSETVVPIESCRGYDLQGLSIFNSTLMYLPSGIFKGTTFKRIVLFDTALMSLSDGPLAFEGLEDTLVELQASKTEYAAQWRISQLRNLKKLEKLDLHNIYLEAIDEDFPFFVNLTEVVFEQAGLSYLGDESFAKCPKLAALDLPHNSISEMKRSMLPNPAEKLELLNLRGNQLSSFPPDFFTAMPKLETVLLSDNQFITIEERAFAKIFPQLDTLDFTGNPLRCDCRLRWLVDGRRPTFFEGRCEQPPSLQDTRMRDLTARDVLC